MICEYMYLPASFKIPKEDGRLVAHVQWSTGQAFTCPRPSHLDSLLPTARVRTVVPLPAGREPEPLERLHPLGQSSDLFIPSGGAVQLLEESVGNHAHHSADRLCAFTPTPSQHVV